MWKFLETRFASFTTHALIAALVRAVMLAFGEWQDQNMIVKYTDVDYHVFTDAALYVTTGQSPYLRHTYRYTPYLAWMMTINIYIHPVAGKILFALCDMIVGLLIYRILFKMGCNKKVSVLSSTLWLYNPLSITISTRGNAESIICMLVLVALYFLVSRQYFLTGLAIGTAIHFKVYPVIYCMPMYFALSERMHPYWLTYYLWPNKQRVSLVVGALIGFLSLTTIAYSLYGKEFIQETYLYHLTRKDFRHNFSVYFYFIYLTITQSTPLVNVLSFLVQFIVLVVISVKFHRYTFMPFCMFATTYVFVTFNKVITSQYYLWYLSLLPLLAPRLRLGAVKGALLVLMWFGTQAIWLSPAYSLEFQGKNTFWYLWMAGVVGFICHVIILCLIMRSYTASVMPIAVLSQLPEKPAVKLFQTDTQTSEVHSPKPQQREINSPKTQHNSKKKRPQRDKEKSKH